MEDDGADIERTFAEIINEQESERFGGNSRRYGALDNAQHGFNFNATNGVENYAFSSDGGTIEDIQLNMMEGNGIREENSSLVRRRTRRTKEVSEGIEDIIEEMPSRTVGRRRGEKLNNRLASLRYSSVRGRRMRIASSTDEVDANEIYEDIATQDGEIDPHELRDLSVNMTLKKQVRHQAQKEREKQKQKSISCFSLWKYNMKMKWTHFKDDFGKFISSASLWNYHLKRIEGTFGTGVLSYFTFLRGIFFLSIPSFLLSFTFISIPQLLDPPAHDSCNFTGEEILTGANCLTDTIMYQGHYTNETINEIGNTYYDMPLAYLFATFGYFIMCFIWLATTTAISFRRNYIDTKEDSTNFISKVFCAWDFGTTSQSTAKLQHKSISTELKEILAELKREDDHRTKCEKFEVFLMRLVSWTFFFGLVVGCMALVYKTNETLICQIKEQVRAPVFQDIVLAMIISTVNLLVPYVISFMTHLERYKYPRHELYISVLRNFLFKMSLLGIVCAFWTSDNLQSCVIEKNTTKLCWETELGQEIYRLMIIDFLFSILFATFCAEFLRKLLSRMTSVINSPEFSISNNVLDLVYAQTLCWIGVYFSPLLAFINIVKYFLLFYIKKVSVMQNCRVSTIRWRAAQSATLFNIVQLISFLLSTGFLVYVIFNQTPSVACGPFRDKSRAYDVVIEDVNFLKETDSGHWFAVLLNIITNIWVLYAFLTFFLVLVIFARSKSKGLEALADTLRDQIGLEGKDKTLLLKWLQNVSKHTMAYHNYDERQSLNPSAAVGIGNVVHTTPIYTRVAKARSMVETEDDNLLSAVPSTSGFQNTEASSARVSDFNDVALESRHSSTYNTPVLVHEVPDVNPRDPHDYNRFDDGDF